MEEYYKLLDPKFVMRFNKDTRRLAHMKTATRVFDTIADKLTLEFSEAEIKNLRLAILLHDIGYFVKGSKSNERHPEYGAELVTKNNLAGKSSVFVADLIRCHGLIQHRDVSEALKSGSILSAQILGEEEFNKRLDVVNFCDISALGGKIGTVHDRLEDIHTRCKSRDNYSLMKSAEPLMIELYYKVCKKYSIDLKSEV